MKRIQNSIHRYKVLEAGEADSGRSEIFGSIFFLLIALILTVLNIVKHASVAMTVATTVLTAGFAVTAFLAYKKKVKASKTVILILCGITFSMFALLGGNDGFAILWILLVPIIGPLWVGLRYGAILGAYFQVFLIVLMYTPMSGLVDGYYTETFMLRFPILYFATFGSLGFLMWQRENLLKKLHRESYFDALTEFRNRRYFIEQSEAIKAKGMKPGFTCFSFDLNGLKHANDTCGHQAGDELLQAAAAIIGKNFDGDCFRTGGDEFAVFADDIDAGAAIENLKKDAAEWKGEYMPAISISVGYAKASEEPGLNFDELLALSDERMYAAKAKYYDENGLQKR